MDQWLHPNLARIAAEYDEICLRFAQKQISGPQARREMAALVARDDQGTQWTIDPSSGGWIYITLAGERVAGTPPTAGLATPTAHDLSNRALNPDQNLRVEAIDMAMLYPPESLQGITYRQPPKLVATGPDWRSPKMIALAVVALLAVVFLVFQVLDSSEESEAPPLAPSEPITPVAPPVKPAG